MASKKWIIKEQVSLDLQNQFPEIEPVVVQLLANRGQTSQSDIERFLNPDFVTDTHSPFLFKDMEKAVQRIYQAIEKKEKITIHGDYDCDGVCSSALLTTILKDLGAEMDVYLPHREKEGYGVNINTVEFLAKEGTKVVITVDCGTTNVEPIRRAGELGMDVIVTDHHHVPEEKLDCYAFINPQNQEDTYPFGFLCGTGVAFKLAQALYITDQKLSLPKLANGYDKWLLDLVAIATVADMMQLVDENRALVKYGLIVIKKTRRVGLKALMERAGVWNYDETPVSPQDIGFVIAPRINAAGRMDHANAAYKLMVTDKVEETPALVEDLEKNNTERRALTEKITEEILAKFPVQEGEYVLVAYGDGWPIGLAGLIASKVMQQIGKPVIIMSKLADRIAGSGRSLPGFNMAEVLEKMKENFSTSGGHAYACGFSLKDGVDPELIINEFKRYAKESLEGRDLRPELIIDGEIGPADITWKLFDQVQQLKPFGMSNAEPVFITRALEIEDFKLVGSDQNHLKLRLRDPKLFKSFSCIGFRQGIHAENLKLGGLVDVAFKLDANEWNGNKELQLKIEDIEIL